MVLNLDYTPAELPGCGLAATQSKAAQGDAEAQFALGVHFSNAAEGTLDFSQAAAWYRQAADQGHALAQFNLGVMFARGQGVLVDGASAAEWMRKAAEGGDASGQYEFGLLCYRASVNPTGPDRAESRIEAYKWLRLAAAQEYGDSTITCERVNLTLSREETLEGNRRTAAFVARVAGTPS